ncbi:MAG TPA: cytochrome c biogenesis protein ResB, partial [Noviherbaspirillum sp.]|nr:cytochrome c biogenesis protein ResB [Noviherbaspirillum sp.]
VVHDPETGTSFPATIKVNHPLIYKGLAVYQSSFDDGGSRLKLTGYSMRGSQAAPFDIEGEVGASTALGSTIGSEYTIEWSDFRAFNVENMAQAGQDLRAVDGAKRFDQRLAAGIERQLGSAARVSNDRELRNVGPSLQYKVRDKTGQAREYHNYMLPVELDGVRVFLSGMRENPNDGFRYLRIPADENGTVEDWMRLRAAVADPELRAIAARQYAARAIPLERDGADDLRRQLEQSALRGLEIFAGDGDVGGYLAVSRFIERVPPGEQEKAAEVFMKILNGSMWELWQAARARAGLAPTPENEEQAGFLQIATNAISDATFYGAPVYLQLKEFEEIKASVLQVTRSPGKNVVYLGCLLLVIGIFAMFYIRERRLWVWIKGGSDGQAHALMALTTQRKTLDFEKDFETLKSRLTQP